MGGRNLVMVIVIITRDEEEKKAIEVDAGNRKRQWIPRSLIKKRVDDKGEGTSAFWVPQWFADKESLEYDRESTEEGDMPVDMVFNRNDDDDEVPF